MAVAMLLGGVDEWKVGMLLRIFLVFRVQLKC